MNHVYVEAIVVNEQSLLLTEDVLEGDRRLPGGYVDSSETSQDSLVRHVRESTGIDIEIQNLVCVYEHLIPEGGYGVTLLYKCDLKSSNRVEGAHWVHLSDVEDEWNDFIRIRQVFESVWDEHYASVVEEDDEHNRVFVHAKTGW
ncbi:NUDIX domain-containing protein [Pontibacillus halophilus]|nr:NUDIX domain-containing protein [Pontibacillus halophilus]